MKREDFKINLIHYGKVYSKRLVKPDNRNFYIDEDYPETYCFALQRFLGVNGLIDDHPLTGKQIVRMNDDLKTADKEYIIQSVHLHWYDGYYYVLLIRDNHNSHGCPMWENLNCREQTFIDAINENRRIYKVVD